MSEDYGAGINEWVEIIRRAPLNQTTKLVALLVASYANPDGTRIYPGLARLSVDAGIDFRTAQRALKTLRDVELIEVAKRGNRRRGQSDQYRLIIGANLLEHVELPSADDYAESIRSLRELRQLEYRHRRWLKKNQTTVLASVDGDDSRQSRDTEASGDQVQTTLPPSEPDYQTTENGLSDDTGATPPSIKHPPYQNQPSIDSDSLRSSGSTDVARDSSKLESLPVQADRDLELAGESMDGKNATTNSDSHRRVWDELQQRYNSGAADDDDVIEFIGLSVGWQLDEMERRTVEGMLADGQHVKAARNTIAKRGAA